ncbi:MAG: c-type cytochrome [Bacteroidota bacterium]
MKNRRTYFALSSILLLVVLAVSPLKDFLREWKLYQYEYNRLIENIPQRIKPAEIGIKQIWVSKLDRVDRCVTCHLGLKVDALKQAKQPFRTHPKIYHDVEEFGCTMCHEGQGLATEYRESVGKVKYWDRPIFPREFMEASCAKCHKERNVPQAPILNLGRRLIVESNCVGCHKIEGYQKQWVPSLDGIGSKVNKPWLVRWLKDPKAYFAKTRMPNFLLSEEETEILADFLMTFTDLSGGAKLEPLPAPLTSASESRKAALIDLGSTRFREARCISCHPVNGKGGSVATDLGKVASKVSKQWLYNYVKNPKHLWADVQMPRYRLNEGELMGVVAYMESEFVDYETEAGEGPMPQRSDPAFYEKGLELFKKYNCGGCHEFQAVHKPEEIAPDLTFIGSKKTYEIDFGKTTVEQTLPSYLQTKLTNPRSFSPTMKMPRFEFSGEEAQAVTVALLGNTSDKIPQEYLVHLKPQGTFVPQGAFGRIVNELACLGCHTMNGSGRLVATDLSLEGSQAQASWIAGYFKVPYSLRPILTERMPNLFLSDGEIKTIVEYMQKVFIADSLDRNVTMDAAAIARGKDLYGGKYGCQSCHQVGGKGGYVGPPLDRAGRRLTAGWIFHWLKNPQAFKPESIEPNNKLTDGEAEALTAYLMSLK